MKQKSWILAVGALMAFAVIWSLRTTSVMSRTVTPIAAGATSPRESLGAAQPSAEVSLSARAEGHRDSVATAVLEMLGTPIAFYGRVVDQNNSPVADAAINYGALDKFGAAGSQYQGRSDAAGNFSIAGIRGAVLRVGVQKEGYYMIDGKSAGAFAYGIRPDSSSKDPPVADRPAVFVLQKMGVTEPLVRISDYHRIERDGSPIEISLLTGKPVLAGKGQLRIEAWTQDQIVDSDGHYDWKCRISVPGGGLVERKGQFDFEAPSDGYKSSDEIEMPRTVEHWRPQSRREYFLKLSDGRYARISVLMVAGGHHYFGVESYLNPKPGSHNLEFDPKKETKSGER